MEGNIVAVYQTGTAICLISDAAYAHKTEEELELVRRDIRATVQGVLERLAREGGEEIASIESNHVRKATEIPREMWPEMDWFRELT